MATIASGRPSGVDLGDSSRPIEIAERVWWVGSLHPDDTFQCHSYLVEAGENSVLVDPGSMLTVAGTLTRAAEVVPLASIRWVVCHHSDPDIAGGLGLVRTALPGADVRVVTEWRAEALLRHYDAGIPFLRVEEHGWSLELDPTRHLRFVLTPYLHFPGAMCSYDDLSGVLFSSDLFGGFSDGSQLVADDASYFESMRPFHEHYMPSREILAAGLAAITRAFGPIRLIAPQHGCIIPEPLVASMFEQLSELECGIFLIAREDLDVARLLQVANALRRITDALVMAHDFPELAAVTERVLLDVLPVQTLELVADTPEDGPLCFSAEDHFIGTPCHEAEPTETTFSFDIPGEGPPARVRLGLARRVDPTSEVREMFDRLAPPLRVALNRHLEHRRQEHQHDQLRESAFRDALTGLLNRHALTTLARIDQQHGVLMIDIDHFKVVNDEFGHAAGDEVLRVVGASIAAAVRPDDATIRYGGEEILVLLRSADRRLTLDVAERLRAGVGALDFTTVPPVGRVTVSIGAAIHNPGQPVGEAIAEADSYLYRAKREGRNRVRAAWSTPP